MEAGKERLTRDTVRDATRQEIEHLKRENHDGRTTTEEPRSETTCCRPFPGGPPLQRNSHPSLRKGRRRISAQEKSEVLARVEETKWGKRKLLDITGMTEVPLEDRTRLLSDTAPGYVSRAFATT